MSTQKCIVSFLKREMNYKSFMKIQCLFKINKNICYCILQSAAKHWQSPSCEVRLNGNKYIKVYIRKSVRKLNQGN